jgi:hypothetical protein
MHRAIKKYGYILLTIFSLLIGWLVFKPNVAVVQQVADPNFNSSIAYPTYTKDAPTVLFDEAHLNFHTTQGRYKPFIDLIANDGYHVVSNKQTFDIEKLSDYDILIIANASNQQQGQPALSEEECDVVEDWVRSSGSLLLIADHKPHGAAVENLASRFDIEMSNKFTVDLSHYDQESKFPSFLLFTRQNGLLAEHPITQGRNSAEQINQIITFTGQSLSIPSQGKALLRLSDSAFDLDKKIRNIKDFRQEQAIAAAKRAQGVILPFGKGRVFVLGEAAMISAQIVQIPNEDKFLVGMNNPEFDNRQFALNSMHWLSGLLD